MLCRIVPLGDKYNWTNTLNLIESKKTCLYIKGDFATFQRQRENKEKVFKICNDDRKIEITSVAIIDSHNYHYDDLSIIYNIKNTEYYYKNFSC